MQVFSVSRNKLTILPTWISQMNSVKILKIENNPWANVPLALVQQQPEISALPAFASADPTTQDALEREKYSLWIKKVQEHLSTDDSSTPYPMITEPPSQTEANDARSTIPDDEAEAAHDSQSFISRTPNPGTLVFKDCDQLMQFYLSHRSSSITSSGGVSSTSTADSKFAEPVTICYAASSLYKSVKVVLSCIPGKNIAWKSIEVCVRDLNKAVLQLLDLLIHSTGRSRSTGHAAVGSGSKEAEIWSLQTPALVAARALVDCLLENSSWVVQYVDTRIVRGFLVQWYGVCSELALLRYVSRV